MAKQRGDALFWGFVILLLGILFLVNNMGWADVDIWELIGRFWPLILIYIGVKNIITYVMRDK